MLCVSWDLQYADAQTIQRYISVILEGSAVILQERTGLLTLRKRPRKGQNILAYHKVTDCLNLIHGYTGIYMVAACTFHLQRVKLCGFMRSEPKHFLVEV